MAAPKSTQPKDSQVMAAILKDMGIIDYEPRVISQMLEFTYRYITGILEDARVFSSHARKKTLDLDDVKLAIQMQMDRSFTTPPPRDILMDIAKQRNNIPLPLIKPHCGPRLPPDRYCLTSCNFKLKTNKKPSTRQYQIGVPFSSMTPKINVQSVVGSKLSPAVNLPSKTGTTLSLVSKGGNAPSVSIVTRPAPSSSNSGPISTPPLIKISAGIPMSTSGTTNSSDSSTPMIVTQTIPASLAGKRKREDDFDLE